MQLLIMGGFIKMHREVFSGGLGKDCVYVCTGVWNTGKHGTDNGM